MSVQNVISYNFPECYVISSLGLSCGNKLDSVVSKEKPSWLAAVSVCAIKIDYCMQIGQFLKWGFLQ